MKKTQVSNTAPRFHSLMAFFAITLSVFTISCKENEEGIANGKSDQNNTTQVNKNAADIRDMKGIRKDAKHGYQIPDTLNPKDGSVVVMSLFASGVQRYEARRDQNKPDSIVWAFVEPVATLYGDLAAVVGTHFRGPTWQSNDGSNVVGALRVRVPANNSKRDIPWLLLSATSNKGAGVFGRVSHIQRIFTYGGQAPVEKLSEKDLGRTLDVFYLSTYRFWAPKE